MREEDAVAVGGAVIVHWLLLFCGRGENSVAEEANGRRDGKLVMGRRFQMWREEKKKA